MADESAAGGTDTGAYMPATGRHRFLVVGASMLGTVFEWYDFFVYGTLASLLGEKFFPPTDALSGFLQSLAVFGAGFCVRPIGAIVFGQLGDRLGRKQTFVATIALMGASTAAVGLLPDYATAGTWAPVLLVALRLLQGLALGGEYGGAAIYVAEHAPAGRRGMHTSWIQSAVSAGFLLSLGVVLTCRLSLGESVFAEWGWRVPFLASVLLLAISLVIRLRLTESPVFRQMKSEGRLARSPLRESFSTWENTRRVLVALFGVAAGFTVIWYCGQFFALFFLQQVLHVDPTTAQLLMAVAALIGVPLMVLGGWASDRFGRRRVLLSGYALALVSLLPLFSLLAGAGNPELVHAMERSPVHVEGRHCGVSMSGSIGTTACARAKAFLNHRGISFTVREDPAFDVRVTLGTLQLNDFADGGLDEALRAAGFPDSAAPEKVRPVLILVALTGIAVLSALTYGPAGALLVELFPARLRYTSLSIPYHIGTGYFGGLLPFIAQYLAVSAGSVYAGVWYALAVVAMAFVVSYFLLPETRDWQVDQ
jgi:MFS family permease